MSLARRTRAVAAAGSGREAFDAALGLIGVAGMAYAAATGQPWVAVPAALALGLILGSKWTNADRRYLEGFADGLVAADDLADTADPRLARAAGSVRELPAGAGDADPGGTAPAAHRRQRRARGGSEPAFDIVAASGIDTSRLDRLPRPRLTGDGDPVDGPRPVEFPRVRSTEDLLATAVRDIKARTSAGSETRLGFSEGTE